MPRHAVMQRSRTADVATWIGLLGFGIIFGLVKARRSDALDVALMIRFQAVRHATLARLMTLVSWPGFPPQSRIIPPIITAVLFLLRLRVEAAMQLLAWGTGGLSTILKSLMRRPRPVAGTDLRVIAAPLGGSSFPSGHVITYVGTYGWLAYVLHTIVRPTWPRRLVVGGLGAFVAFVGPSRIYQGHHWPTDVAASYFLGLTYVISLASIYRRLKAKSPSVASRLGR